MKGTQDLRVCHNLETVISTSTPYWRSHALAMSRCVFHIQCHLMSTSSLKMTQNILDCLILITLIPYSFHLIAPLLEAILKVNCELT